MDGLHLARRQGESAGATLIEVLVVIAVLTMMLSVMMTAYNSVKQVSASAQIALDRMRQVTELQAEFNAVVHRAAVVAEGVGEHRTGPDRLVLELPKDPDGTRHFTVLGCVKPGKFSRLDVVDRAGVMEAGYFKAFPLPVKTARFNVANGRAVTLKLSVINAARGRGKPPILYKFVAALRSLAPGEGGKVS